MALNYPSPAPHTNAILMALNYPSHTNVTHVSMRADLTPPTAPAHVDGLGARFVVR